MTNVLLITHKLFTMTYREKIQAIAKQLDTIYDDAECLRDVATMEEKAYWSLLRERLAPTISLMNKLDNSLSQNRANHKL